jgi:predicted deacylase
MRTSTRVVPIRVGNTLIAPGTARVVRLGVLDTEAPEAGVPAWAAVGRHPGPRVAIMAAPGGHEVGAAMAAEAIAAVVDPKTLAGTLVVVPVLRPGGRFAPAGRLFLPMPLPGDPGGQRPSRRAFSVFADTLVGAAAAIVVTAPRPWRSSMLRAVCDLGDGRAVKLARASGAEVVTPPAGAASASLRAAAQAGATAIELSFGGDDAEPTADAEILEAAIVRCLGSLGLLEPRSAAAEPPALMTSLHPIAATTGGRLSDVATVGQVVRARAVLARVRPPFAAEPRSLTTPVGGIVIEAPRRSVCREGIPLFLLGAPTPQPRRRPRPVIVGGPRFRVGWVEQVALPKLGLRNLEAKVDTGARSSALHVERIRALSLPQDGEVPGRANGRDWIEITLPRAEDGSEGARVRVPVREYAEIKDSSGRTARRPVIETTLVLGSLRRRVRVTLTNRGDMQYAMLVGRTALGPGVVVDPHAKHVASHALDGDLDRTVSAGVGARSSRGSRAKI